MSVSFQITDGCGLHTTSRSPMRQLCCSQAGMAGGRRTIWWPVGYRVSKALAVSETQGRDGHYKVNSTRSLKHTTHLLWSGQCSTPPKHRHYSTHRGYTSIRLCLEAGISADCGLASLWVHSHPVGSEVKAVQIVWWMATKRFTHTLTHSVTVKSHKMGWVMLNVPPNTL